MNKSLLFKVSFFILFFSNCFLNAQVTSREQVPLSQVLKSIEDKHKVTFTYADSNIEGKLITPPSDNFSLKELINYLKKETKLHFELLSNNSIIIQRIDTAHEFSSVQYLDEVLVRNYLTKGISLKENGLTQFSPSEFGILPGLIEPDVLHSLQALPGIFSVDERVSNINVRGGTNDQNLILWDGIKMYNSGHFFGLISAFNPYLTEDVFVSKNGTSAMYGDGISSVIDMRSSNQIDNKLTSGVGLNLIHGDANAKIPIGNHTELQLSARRSITDLLATPTYDAYFKRIFQDTDITNTTAIQKNEQFYFYDFSGKLLVDISPNDKLRINALNIYNKLNYDETSRQNDIDESLNSELIQRNLALGVSYEKIWNDRLQTKGEIYLSNYDLDATNFDVINQQRLIQENEVYDGGLKFHLNYTLENGLSYFGGYQFTEVGISNLEDVNNPIFRRYIKEVLRSHAIFNEITFRSTSNKTRAKVGLRSNYVEKFDEIYVEPRISLSHKFLRNLRVELLGEIKSQFSSQIIDLQNDFLGVEKRRWILANNEDIPVLESKQLSLGLQYKKNGLLVSVDGYLKKVSGITSRSQGFQNQFQYVDDLGEYMIKGVDILINKQLDKLGAWVSYSFGKNEYTFETIYAGDSFPNNMDITHSINFAGTYTFDRLKIAGGLNWRTGKPYTETNALNPTNGSTINYNAPNNSNLPDYLRADLSINYQLNLGDETESIVGFSLWNVLNRKNIINSYFILDDEINISQVENYSLGITPNFSFRLRF